MHLNVYLLSILMHMYEVTNQYILIGKAQRKSNQNFKLESNFAPCVLNYLFLEGVLFPNFRIKCGTTS